MPIPTPFHSRTSALCRSGEWADWVGYSSAVRYDHSYEYEYFAIRNAAALIDVSPLFKYEVTGPDALAAVNRIMTRDIARCEVGRVMYTPWCDQDGKLIEDGTVSRLADDHLRLTAAERSLLWFEDCSFGLNAQIRDVSQELAVVAIQGPLSRRILKRLWQGVDLDSLRYFRLAQGTLGGQTVTLTRTGYTGDLGFEVWIEASRAEALWDALMEVGSDYGLAPAGLAALDMVRIEAGLLLIHVDFFSSRQALSEVEKSTPFEVGLGWAVSSSKDDYVGRCALMAEKASGSKWSLMGIEVDWVSLERLFDEIDLPPQVTGRASREAVPLYRSDVQIGQVTSRTFSPVLKKYIGLASVRCGRAHLGEVVEMEVTVDYVRRRVPARLVSLPFFDPPRKRA